MNPKRGIIAQPNDVAPAVKLFCQLPYQDIYLKDPVWVVVEVLDDRVIVQMNLKSMLRWLGFDFLT